MSTFFLRAFALLLFFTTATALHAQVPQLVSYQGRVTVGGVNFSGSGSFRFALVNTTGTTTFWSNDGTGSGGSQPTNAVSLTVTSGLYSVLLGDTTLTNMTAIPASVWTNADVRLRVWFDDNTHGPQLLTPDQRLAPHGYLPDGGVANAKLANSSVTVSAGTGLTGGGTVALGGTITLNANTGTGANQLVALNGTGQLPAISGANLTSLSGGNLTAGTVALGALSTSAVSINTPSSIVLRDASGNFSANTITAALNGNASTAGSATNFSGSLTGDVTGGQTTTTIAAATVTAKLLTGFSSTTGTVSATDSILSAIDKFNGNIALKAPLASPTFTGTVAVPANGFVVGTNQLIAVGGNVGIGVTVPGVPLDVSAGPLVTLGAGAWFSSSSAGQSLSTWTSGIQGSISIRAANAMNATAFIATSDERIKVIDGISDGAEDLKKLQGIQITDYHFRDKISKGDAPYKKVIAQQVEEVYPQAVSRTTDVVPDIYRKATCKDGWITVDIGLKKGERVRLISDQTTGVFEVLEAESGRFRTAFAEDGRVFVYGREVKDFRLVDYEAIAMLNVSATQQIKKEKDAQIAALEKRLAELEAKDRERETRLAKLEQFIPMTPEKGATTAAATK